MWPMGLFLSDMILSKIFHYIFHKQSNMRLLNRKCLALMGVLGGAKKYVSTLSPLGSVFNSIPAPKKSVWFAGSKENKVCHKNSDIFLNF